MVLGFLKNLFGIDQNCPRLGRLIHKGYNSKVYKGKWKGRRVAVKCIDLDKWDWITNDNEIHILFEIRDYPHPNIVNFIDAYKTSRFQYLIMEYVVGGTLHKYIHDSKHYISEQDIRKFSLEIISGIKHLHDHNIIHHDIKTMNILLDLDQHVKLCDFGLSQKTYDIRMISGGTAAYAAPELLYPIVYEFPKYDEKIDIYSFGIVLWVMCSRSDPYEGLCLSEIMKTVVENGMRPPISPQVPPLFRGLMEKCWVESPLDRPSAEEIHSMLS